MDENKLPNQQEPKKGFNIYILILFLLFTVSICLVTFVLPSLKNIFEGQGELPFMTRMILSISEFLQSYFVVIIIAILILYIVYQTKWKRFLPQIDLDSVSNSIILYGTIVILVILFAPMYCLVDQASVLGTENIFSVLSFKILFLLLLFGMVIACIVDICKSKNSDED